MSRRQHVRFASWIGAPAPPPRKVPKPVDARRAASWERREAKKKPAPVRRRIGE